MNTLGMTANQISAHYEAVIEAYKKGIQDAIAEIETEKQGADGIVKFGMNKALEIIRKHTGIGGDAECKR